MRLYALLLALMLCFASGSVFAQTPAGGAATAAQGFSTSETPLGDILDNPQAKAILDKYAPQISKGEQIDMARGMTLESLQPYASDILTDEVLAHMDADFKTLPPKK
jgi:hypothetical protein